MAKAVSEVGKLVAFYAVLFFVSLWKFFCRHSNKVFLFGARYAVNCASLCTYGVRENRGHFFLR